MKQLIISLSMMLVSVGTQAQSIFIESSDGTTTTIDLDSFESIVFDNNNLIVTSSETECEGDYYNAFYVSKIHFGNNLAVNEVDSHSSVKIYPNPVEKTLYLSGKELKNKDAQIYNALGQMVKKTQLSSNENEINVSNLKAGVYVLSIEGLTFKFIKK